MVGVSASQGGPLADKSAQSIMSNVEIPPSRLKRLTSGLAIGPREEDDAAAAMKSHSVGDLSSVSIKSLPGVASKGEGEDSGEDPGNKGGDMEDTVENDECTGMSQQSKNEDCKLDNYAELLYLYTFFMG